MNTFIKKNFEKHRVLLSIYFVKIKNNFSYLLTFQRNGRFAFAIESAFEQKNRIFLIQRLQLSCNHHHYHHRH